MKTVLVTGGAGFIGSHVCKALAEGGYQPVTFDNFSRGFRELVRFGPCEEGDIRDRARVVAALTTWQPVGVIHLAGLAYVRESFQQPLAYYDHNVVGSLRLLEAMTEARVGNIVFSSTCATYGTAQYLPIDEAHPTQPINPYGASKLAVERMLHDSGGATGLRSVCLRYFNAAGSDPDGTIGECHDPETHIIPLCVQAALGEIEALELLGDDHATPDGTALRDFIHVGDLAAAHVRALQHLEAGRPSVVLNLGTGNAVSVREIIATVERVTGRKVPIRLKPRHAGDPPALVATAAKAQAVLGFQPRFASVQAMVEHTFAWHVRARSDVTAVAE